MLGYVRKDKSVFFFGATLFDGTRPYLLIVNCVKSKEDFKNKQLVSLFDFSVLSSY